MTLGLRSLRRLRADSAEKEEDKTERKGEGTEKRGRRGEGRKVEG